MKRFHFGPASRDELTVFGAQRPGYDSGHAGAEPVREWIASSRTPIGGRRRL